MIKHLLYKINEVGMKNTFVGIIRREYYKKLQQIYNYDVWHVSPYELRKYAQDVVQYINSDPNITNEIIDLGCGLGEVIRNIKADNRYGFDLDESAIKVAKLLDKSCQVEYLIGSFDEIGVERTIDYLITLGFMHGSNEEFWAPIYQRVCERNDIKKIIVDVLPPKKDSYQLDFYNIIPDNYKLVYEVGPYLGGRMLQCWEKNGI